MLKEFSLLCFQKKALQKYLHAKIDTKWVCVKKRNMAKIAQNYTNTRNSQYTQQSLFCNKIGIKIKETWIILIVVDHIKLERTYKPHYHYQNFSPLANGTDLNREKYAILQTHWH